MNYELIESLKDAGFPLQSASLEDSKDSKRKSQIFYYGKDEIGRQGSCLFPTLSELIEACGEDFMMVSPTTNFTKSEETEVGNILVPHHKDKWMAVTLKEVGIDAQGKTPEEAVAKLWLKLNKK